MAKTTPSAPSPKRNPIIQRALSQGAKSGGMIGDISGGTGATVSLKSSTYTGGSSGGSAPSQSPQPSATPSKEIKRDDYGNILSVKEVKQEQRERAARVVGPVERITTGITGEKTYIGATGKKYTFPSATELTYTRESKPGGMAERKYVSAQNILAAEKAKDVGQQVYTSLREKQQPYTAFEIVKPEVNMSFEPTNYTTFLGDAKVSPMKGSEFSIGVETITDSNLGIASTKTERRLKGPLFEIGKEVVTIGKDVAVGFGKLGLLTPLKFQQASEYFSIKPFKEKQENLAKLRQKEASIVYDPRVQVAAGAIAFPLLPAVAQTAVATGFVIKESSEFAMNPTPKEAAELIVTGAIFGKESIKGITKGTEFAIDYGKEVLFIPGKRSTEFFRSIKFERDISLSSAQIGKAWSYKQIYEPKSSFALKSEGVSTSIIKSELGIPLRQGAQRPIIEVENIKSGLRIEKGTQTQLLPKAEWEVDLSKARFETVKRESEFNIYKGSEDYLGKWLQRPIKQDVYKDLTFAKFTESGKEITVESKGMQTLLNYKLDVTPKRVNIKEYRFRKAELATDFDLLGSKKLKQKTSVFNLNLGKKGTLGTSEFKYGKSDTFEVFDTGRATKELMPEFNIKSEDFAVKSNAKTLDFAFEFRPIVKSRYNSINKNIISTSIKSSQVAELQIKQQPKIDWSIKSKSNIRNDFKLDTRYITEQLQKQTTKTYFDYLPFKPSKGSDFTPRKPELPTGRTTPKRPFMDSENLMIFGKRKKSRNLFTRQFSFKSTIEGGQLPGRVTIPKLITGLELRRMR